MDFETQTEELDILKDEITKRIEKLKDINVEADWGVEIQALQDKFSELQMSFGNFNDSIPEFEAQDQEDARKYYAKMNNDLQTLESTFNDIKKAGFIRKGPSLAEQFKDQEDNIPEPLKHVNEDIEKKPDLPNNSLVDDVVLSPVDAIPADINSPLNPLEADIETQEDGTPANHSCSRTKKIVIAASVICIILSLICFIIFLSH